MRIYITLIMSIFLLFNQSVMASVVMTGTRIIYASQLKEKSVQLRNTGKEPYIVQVQIDDGSAENKASDSFVITPPIFRMEPGSGQSVRLMFTGKQLPQDRESLFYMNFTQLPVSQAKEQGNNQLVLAITNRVKVFYRPQGVTGQQSATGQALSLTKVGNKIKVNNPTGYYAVIRQASLLINGQQIKLADSVMIPPKSSAEWTPSQPITSLTGAHLKLILVNDYGMDVESARIL